MEFIERIVNGQTNEVIEKPYTKEQLADQIKMQAKLEAAEEAAASLAALKASAKAKLIAGEPLTAAEADTLVI